MVSGLMISSLQGQEEIKIEWRPLKVAKSQFPRTVGMMDETREDYANNLSGLAIKHLIAKKADKEASELARKMIVVALHLSPKNKRAVVLNFQLGKGKVPAAPETAFQHKTMVRLLMTLGQQLQKQEGAENLMVAGYFFSLATEMDPGNEDAIYHSELYRINHGDVDWTKLFLAKE